MEWFIFPLFGLMVKLMKYNQRGYILLLKLQVKVIVITGGAGGIGSGMAKAMEKN